MMVGEVAEERGVEIGMEGIETKKTSSCRVIRTGTLLGFSKTLISLFVYFFQNSNTMANATT